MKSFLLKDGKPIIKWGNLSQGTMFIGNVPEGFDLAISPSENIVILDVDVKKQKNGFEHIPVFILQELEKTFNYKTNSGGRHYWIKYTGNITLLNRATDYGLDLRVSDKGYVKYYHHKPIQECIHLIKESSIDLNKWLEKLFSSHLN